MTHDFTTRHDPTTLSPIAIATCARPLASFFPSLALHFLGFIDAIDGHGARSPCPRPRSPVLLRFPFFFLFSPQAGRGLGAPPRPHSLYAFPPSGSRHRPPARGGALTTVHDSPRPVISPTLAAPPSVSVYPPPRPLWILCSFSSDNLCIMPSIDCIAYYLPPVCVLYYYIPLSLCRTPVSVPVSISISISYASCTFRSPRRASARACTKTPCMRAHERPRRDCHPRARRSTVDRPHIPGSSGRRPRLHDRDAQRSLDHRAGARTGKGKETALGHRPPAHASPFSIFAARHLEYSASWRA